MPATMKNLVIRPTDISLNPLGASSSVADARVSVVYDRDVWVDGQPVPRVPLIATSIPTEGLKVPVLVSDDPSITEGAGFVIKVVVETAPRIGQHNDTGTSLARTIQVVAADPDEIPLGSKSNLTQVADPAQYADVMSAINAAAEAKAAAAQVKTSAATMAADVAASKTAATQAASSAAAAQQTAASMVGPTDAGVAQIVQSGAQTSAALQQSYTRRARTPLMLLDYAVGDGKADDTAAVMQALADASSQKRALYSPRGATFNVPGGVTIASPVRLEGAFTFTTTASIENLITFSATIDLSSAYFSVNGASLATNGVLIKNAGRSNLGTISVTRCQGWGIKVAASGNNNFITADRYTGTVCGTAITTSVTQTAVTSNVSTSLGGYSTLTLSTPIPAALANLETTQWVIYNGNAYKINAISDASTIQVLNLDLTNASSPSITIVCGGALGILKYGDSGVGKWGALDLRSNSGVGIMCAALYGHQFDNAVLQGHAIAIACTDYTNGIVFSKPYFELNTVNIASWGAMQGAVTDPILPLTPASVQYVGGRISLNPTIPQLIFRQGGTTNGGFTTDLTPTTNPAARTITLGQTYAFYRSGGSWAFTMNSANRTVLGQIATVLVLTHGTTNTAFPITITPSTSGETIEGAASYSGAITGHCVIYLTLIGTDWKVTIERDRTPATSVSSAPVYAGQHAIVGGVVYVAAGTTAASDWKQVS